MTMPSVVSRVSEYAPGWLADYATVASALRDNYSALGPFEMSDVMIGITYLREEERRKRAEDLKSMVGKPPDADVLGRGPTPAELDDLRALCHATEAAYLEDRDKLAAALNEIKHQVVVSEHTSKFQKPAHYVSQRVDTGDIFFVVRGTASLKDALTDGDCAPKPLDSKLPEMAGAQAHRGMQISAEWLVRECRQTLRNADGNITSMKKTPKITVLGHSLGAGAAAIAAILLREHFPTLRCVAFATPPCLDDLACSACEKYLVSVVLHDDVIPRASFQNVENLRVRLQNIDWKTMAAADFAESKTGRAMRAAGTAKEALERRTAEAVKAGGDLTAKLLTKGRSLLGGGKANAAASGKGSSGELAASAMDAAGKAGAAAAAAGKKGAAAASASARKLAGKFSGLTAGAFGKKSDVVDVAPAGASDAADAAPPERLFPGGSEKGAPPLFFVPGKIFHLRRGVQGAGSSSATIRRDAATLSRVELSASLVADHSLCEYQEALDALAVKGPAPKTEIRGSLELLELDGDADMKLKGAAMLAGMGGLFVGGAVAGFMVGGLALYKKGAARDMLRGKGLRWNAYHDCFVLAHETCLKRPPKDDGELYPEKFELADKGWSVRKKADFQGKTARGLEIVDGEGVTVLSLHVPAGDAEYDAWVECLERCCRGDKGEPAPGPLAK